MNEKLKIGLLIDDYCIPFWAFKMIDKIIKSDYAEIKLTVKNNSKPSKEKLLEKIQKSQHNLLYLLYQKFENKLFKPSPNAFELKDIRELLSVDEIAVTPNQKKFSDRFNEADLEKIEKYQIDVFIRLGFRILRGGILNAAKYGVWSFHHGDNEVNRGGPPGVWEVLNGWDETGVVLQILTEDLDNGIILCRSYAKTDTFSINRNLNNYYWKALSFVPRKLQELYEKGETAFFNRVDAENNQPYFYYNRLFISPNNAEILSKLFSVYSRKARQKISDIFSLEQWILLFTINDKEELSKSFFRFKKIIPPKDRFWADPHPIKKNDLYYVFFEELIYKNNKAHISVLTIDEKGNYSKPDIVLEKDYHLSYPFIIEDDGEIYMIPETLENGTIEMYKCVEFPLKWELETVLMEDVQAVDSTIHRKDGKYWLFANIIENEGASTYDELFLFSSDKLNSREWKPHPQNPIVSDVKKARPAGKIFEHRGKLYRPGQNCSKRYGYGMQICQITELNTESYKEENVQSIFPNWDKNLLSTHTLNSVSKLTIIDGLIRRRK